MRELKEFLVFLVKIYLRHWFECILPTHAPLNDLELLKTLTEYRNINSKISAELLLVMSRHLWYLSEESIGLAFFDRRVGFDEKRQMVAALKKLSSTGTKNMKRLQIDLKKINIKEKQLHDFINANTKEFFNILFTNSSTNFLDQDPEKWYSDAEYLHAEKIVKNLQIVNDIAERGIAMVTKYNDILTHDEMELQNIIQIVENHRENLPFISKRAIIDHFE